MLCKFIQRTKLSNVYFKHVLLLIYCTFVLLIFALYFPRELVSLKDSLDARFVIAISEFCVDFHTSVYATLCLKVINKHFLLNVKEKKHTRSSSQ